MRRAARWDGAVPLFLSAKHGYPPPVDEVRDLVAYVRGRRDDPGLPFEVVLGGASPTDAAGARGLLVRSSRPASPGGTSDGPWTTRSIGSSRCFVASRQVRRSSPTTPRAVLRDEGKGRSTRRGPGQGSVVRWSSSCCIRQPLPSQQWATRDQ